MLLPCRDAWRHLLKGWGQENHKIRVKKHTYRRELGQGQDTPAKRSVSPAGLRNSDP